MGFVNSLQHFNKTDEWYTPKSAVEIILPYIPKGSVVWCPFDKVSSQYVQVLGGGGIKVINSHIETGQDFFKYEPDEPYDYIVSNPPFSKKEAVLERLFSLGKPFAMIMNINGLFDSKKRFEMLKKVDIQLLIPYGRVNFIEQDNGIKRGVPFQSIYVCWKMLPKQICYQEEDLGLFSNENFVW